MAIAGKAQVPAKGGIRQAVSQDQTSFSLRREGLPVADQPEACAGAAIRGRAAQPGAPAARHIGPG